MKIFLIILCVFGVSAGSYYYYHRNYVDTLMLSQIVGHTDDNMANFAVNLLDFDTGLTRHDLKRLKSSREYWCQRMNEVDAIQDATLKQKESERLLAEMMEDPTLKKICTGILKLGSDVSFGLIKTIL